MEEEQDDPVQDIQKQLEVLADKNRNTRSEQGVIPWEILLECLQHNNNIEAVALMKKFGGSLKKADWTSDHRCISESDANQCLKILTQIFVIVEPKGALCRTTASILQGLPAQLHQQVIDHLKRSLICQLDSNTTQEIRVCKVHLVGACMENFPRGEKCLASCMETVLDFLTKALQTFHISTRSSVSAANQTELMKNCLATIKTTMAVIQKLSPGITEEFKNEHSSCRGSIEAFMELAWSILSDDTFVADCRSAAGMAVPLVMKTLASEETLAIQILNLLTDGKSPVDGNAIESDPDQRRRCSKSWNDLPSNLMPSSQLFLYHGVLAMLSVKDLLQSIHSGGCLLVDIIFPFVFQLTERLADSSSTLAASRTLTLWTNIALTAVTKHPENTPLKSAMVGSACIPQSLIQYVWTNWDHPVDGMRHQTRMIFENVIHLHLQALSEDSSSDLFLLKLLQDLTDVSWHVRGKYGPLGCLAQHLGTARILGLYPTMHHTILDMLVEQTLVPYACDLMVKLFTNHLQELTSLHGGDEGLNTWQDTWVLPALELLCNPAKPKHHKGFLVEYYMPKLLKFSPESLTYIVDHLQQHNQSTHVKVNSDQLGPLLTCLKTSRTLGLIKAGKKDNKEGMWKGLVSISVLQQALCHRDSQVQLNALGLLCDSNKTTEQFSRVELRLLSMFLSLNMNNSSPSFRQQMCSHIKKMLIRLRESGRLLSKHTSTSKKGSYEQDDKSNEAALISTYKNFVNWLCEFQFTNLEPGANYPRRATALYILSMVVHIFNSPNKQGKHQSLFNTHEIWTPSHVQLLMMRLTDNYESNKVMAFDLLNGLSQETLGFLDRSYLDSMYSCSLELACSNKPHYCESASYILRVLSRQLQQPLKMAATSQEQCIMGFLQDLCGLLQSQVGIARESLLEASVQGPMYGILHCIREVSTDVNYNCVVNSSDWRDMLQTIISLCFDVAQVASAVVCNSSPEGYLPSENSNNDVADSDTDLPLNKSSQDVTDSEETKRAGEVTTLQVTPQMVLVCCWRSMKEVSLLLGQLTLNVPVGEVKDEMTSSKSSGLITEKQVVEVGELFLQLLKESKHRGAFELAYVGFVKLCTKLWRSNTQSLHELPEKWLEGLMNDVTSDQPMLCATRRSAGIPFAIQALLNSEPAIFSKQHFKSVMSSLLNLALPDSIDSQSSSTSQVHALNILRALFRDTHHGEDVFPYVANGVRAAILGFQAKLWAVRNSATMLFSALITRIFGVKRGKEEQARKNCMTGREFFSRFPALHGFLLTQLTAAAQKIDSSAKAHLHPALFPVLLLLSRLYPSAMDGSNSSLSMAVFVPLVLRCAGSAVFKTRCIAARALVAVVPKGNVPNMMTQLIETLPTDSLMISSQANVCHNSIHGVLLQIQCLLESHLQNSSISGSSDMQTSIASVLPQLGNCLWLATRDNHCYVTRSAMLLILNTFILDQSWISPSNLCQQEVQQSLKPMKMALYSIIKSNSSGTSNAGDTQQPGFNEWQTAHGLMCQKIIRDEDVLKNVMDGKVLTSDKTVDDSDLEQKFGMSCKISESPPDFKDVTSISTPDPCSRSKLDGAHKQGNQNVDEEVITMVLGLLSSPHYEVRALALESLLNDHTYSQGDSILGEAIGIEQANLWSKVIQSQEIFHVLVTMVIGEGREDHPACIEKALLLLSHHPLSLKFPWQLLGGNHLTCLDCFNKILKVASLVNQRDEIICAAIQMSTTLIPDLFHSIKEGQTEAVSKALQDWTNLLEYYSQPEQSNQSRTVVANTLSKLAVTVLIDPNHVFGFQIPSRLWGVVIHLLQDDETQVQNAACHCVKQAIAAMPTLPISEAYSQTDFQSSLALEVCLSVMTSLYANTVPNKYIQTLVSWLIGAMEGEECIVGNKDTPEDDGKEQVPEDRLFDRGEANTNYEQLLLGKAILKELQTLAATITTDHTTNDAATTIPDPDPCHSANETTCPTEIDSGRAYHIKDHTLSRKAVEFESGSGYGNPIAHNTRGVRPVVLNTANRHSLVTVTQGMTCKILVALERFLKNTSDVSPTTPYLDTTGYETNCVRCWCLLAGLLGVGLFPDSEAYEGNSSDNKVKRMQVVQLAVDKFGGNMHCNPLILKMVNEIREL